MLPDISAGVLDRENVRVEFRVLATTPKALRIAKPFLGPDSAASSSTWVPRSLLTFSPTGTGFNIYALTLPVFLYRRVRTELG
jgi:hypothetical protein